MTALELHLFGPPRVRRDGADVRFDTRKAPALLAVLAVSGREHGRDALAGMLWPDLDRVRARAALRRTLSVASAVGPALQVSSDGAGLDLERVWCDVREFRELAQAPDPASWERAAELATDAFLEGFALRDSPAFEDWQIAVADSLRDAASHNLGRLVADAVARGDMTVAVAYARRRIRIEPLSEPAHADLIRVTAASGDRPGALTAYRALVRLLDRELGVPPLPETLALHAAIRAGAPLPATASVIPPSNVADAASGPPPLHGREDLIARLNDALGGAAAGGGCIGLVGEAGIGKTAIVHAFASRVAGDGTRVLRIAGHAAETGLAYAAANDLLRGMLTVSPDVTSELGATGEPLRALTSDAPGGGSRAIGGPGDLQRVHEAVRAALAVFAADGAVVVIDDAHLLDPPSAAVVGFCLRRAPRGLLVVATWTAGEGDAPLPAAVADAGPVITISPLDLAGVAAVLEGTGHDAREVLARTRGVPLLVGEYAIADAPIGVEGPRGARELVSSRFQSASPITRQLVAAAAVVGTVADPELLRVACGRDEGETVDAIEEAVARGLLVERADRPGYDVPHDLVRDTALSWLSMARARLVHGRVADVLARRHGVDPRATAAGAVARHLAAAGRDEEATTWFLSAADDAARLYAHPEALELLREAGALGYRALDVHQAVGSTLVRLGRYTDALVSLDRACAIAEPDADRQAEIEHAIAGVYDRLGEPTMAQAHLEAARDLIGGAGGGRTARILADLALEQHRRGRGADAERTAREAFGAAEASGDAAALAQGANVLAVISAARGDHAEAETHARHAVDRAHAAGDLDLLIAASNNLSHVLAAAGDEDGALEAARVALGEAERQGDRHRLAALHSHLADLLHAAGREDEAIESLKSSAAAFADVQDAQARPEVWTLTEW